MTTGDILMLIATVALTWVALSADRRGGSK